MNYQDAIRSIRDEQERISREVLAAVAGVLAGTTLPVRSVTIDMGEVTTCADPRRVFTPIGATVDVEL